MSRLPRIKSKTGYYHVMLRGNEKRNIFVSDTDKLHFIEIVGKMKKSDRFYLYAYCLMNNHIHMMISEGTEDIAKILKRITVSYVSYFNKKYKRVGHLFQDRFKSEVVNEDEYALTLVRYIHQNPIKAGMVKYLQDYLWSSYNTYIKNDDEVFSVIDKDPILGMFSAEKTKAKILFSEYMNKDNKDNFYDLQDDQEDEIDDKKALEIFNQMLVSRGFKLDSIKIRKVPNELLIEYKNTTQLSARKISNIIGVNKDILCRILRENIQ